jgi:YidC/Oxa1 family membrane protein insertase
MERGSITKYLLLGLAIFLLLNVGKPLLFPSKAAPLQPLVPDETAAAVQPPEESCTIEAPRFKAELGTHGASLQHVYLKDKNYTRPSPMPSDLGASVLHVVTGDGKGSDQPADLVSTTRPGRAPLRVDLRAPGAEGAQQVPYDDLDWKLAASDGKSCTFTYADESSSLKKVVALGDEPFELTVDVTVQNTAATAKKHRFTIEQTSYRTKKEMEGHLGRQSELVTKAIAITPAKSEFETPSDFEPSSFAKPEFNGSTWRRAPGEAKLVAVSSIYFTKLVIPEVVPEGGGNGAPVAETQVEEVWNADQFSAAHKENDPAYGYVFRARLAYPEKELAPGASAHYRAVSYAGPKERDLLARIDRGAPELLEFGVGTFSFATKDLARALVWYLLKIYGVIGSWGWSIVVLTISVRMLVFPLSLSQIKNSAAMRKLKPEMDVINEKYKDDAAQKGVAIQELWRKNGVSNPVVGCLPMLLTMPVWWALYTALQTAVELYHVPFGPVIPDLSAPGRYLIIPIVLGGSSLLQQKLMPAQGDPAQQRMMMYLMPGIFTVMMLVLPAGLGLYMVTNSVLAIGQQLFVERYLKANAGPTGEIEVREKSSSGGGKPAPALGKGKARARG